MSIFLEVSHVNCYVTQTDFQTFSGGENENSERTEDGSEESEETNKVEYRPSPTTSTTR